MATAMAMRLFGARKPWPSSGATRYSTALPFSRSATTIWSDSCCVTRGSLAPCTTSSGTLIWSQWKSGERAIRSSRSASIAGLPTRLYHEPSRNGFQYSGKLLMSVSRFDGPT